MLDSSHENTTKITPPRTAEEKMNYFLPSRNKNKVINNFVRSYLTPPTSPLKTTKMAFAISSSTNKGRKIHFKKKKNALSVYLATTNIL